MRVIIAAGGTGGHLYPGVALAREFARQVPGSETIFVGTTRGLETKVVPREGFELITIRAKGIMGKGVRGLLLGLLVLPVGLLQCLALCRTRRPDLVIGIGGYTTPTLLWASALLGIKRVILEPNAYPGAANRILAPLAHRVFVSFPETVPLLGARRSCVVGTPIRREFVEGTPRATRRGTTLLVVGGSQGARSINRAMIEALPQLLAAGIDLHIIHQTGDRDYEEVVGAYRKIWPEQTAVARADATEPPGTEPPARVEVAPFLYDVPRAFHHADLIVCRSGATTVAELTACGKPAILIPFPHAIYGHQERNARVLERGGAAQVLLDSDLAPGILATAILVLLQDPVRLAKMARSSQALGRPDSAAQVVAACRELVGA